MALHPAVESRIGVGQADEAFGRRRAGVGERRPAHRAGVAEIGEAADDRLVFLGPSNAECQLQGVGDAEAVIGEKGEAFDQCGRTTVEACCVLDALRAPAREDGAGRVLLSAP